MKKQIIIIAGLLFLIIGNSIFISCSKKEENTQYAFLLEAALQQAGKNRGELEKVLTRYKISPADSLKYKAACFLIENMPNYGFHKGQQLEQYLTYYPLLQTIRGKDIKPEVIADSIRHMYGPFHLDSLDYYKDIETVDSAYLCHNIEWSFKVWQEQPWGKYVSFADFCEYLLPYRIGDEILCRWREDIYRKYNPILDSLRASNKLDKEDPIVAARYLLESISNEQEVYFTTTAPADLPHVGPKVAQLKSGSCREFTDYVVYVCRALGIPCAIDFMPLRGDENDSHEWVSFADKYGTLYFQEFPAPLVEVRKDKICTAPKIKVYRRTFSLNQSLQETLLQLDTTVVPLFQHPHIIDVTFSYTQDFKRELEIPATFLYKGKPRSQIAYICASKRMDWEPVAWTKFDQKRLVFKEVQKGSVMRIATYEKGRLRFWTDPFEINASNEFHFFTPADSVQDITLFAKHTLRAEGIFCERMVGGAFEGSNDPEFRQKDLLYTIERMPKRLQTIVYSRSSKPYRYIRYIGPENAHCNIAEAAFYTSSSTDVLKGRAIGTPGCYQKDKSHEYTNAFDENPSTSFDYLEPSGGWTGLDLGTPHQIGQIVYTPRNYDNYIRQGDTYELFYCAKKDKWESLGVQIPETDSLVYKEVPCNALLLLCNYTRGIQERIFTYEDKVQIWK